MIITSIVKDKIKLPDVNKIIKTKTGVSLIVVIKNNKGFVATVFNKIKFFIKGINLFLYPISQRHTKNTSLLYGFLREFAKINKLNKIESFTFDNKTFILTYAPLGFKLKNENSFVKFNKRLNELNIIQVKGIDINTKKYQVILKNKSIKNISFDKIEKYIPIMEIDLN